MPSDPLEACAFDAPISSFGANKNLPILRGWNICFCIK